MKKALSKMNRDELEAARVKSMAEIARLSGSSLHHNKNAVRGLKNRVEWIDEYLRRIG